MNDSNRPVDGLDLLDAPPPASSFWDDLRRGLVATELRPTESTWDGQAPAAIDAEPAAAARPRRARRATLLGAAAAVALLAGGALAVVRWAGEPDQARVSIPPGAVVIDDPMAIDLDPWVTDPPLTGGPFVVFDVEHLPDGWTLEWPAAGVHVTGDSDPAHYTWSAAVTTDSGLLVQLSARFTGQDSIGTQDRTVVDVHGQRGAAGDGTVTWFDPSGTWLRVQTHGLGASEITALAEQLALITVDRLPAPDRSDLGNPVRGTVRLGGTVGGERWEVVTSGATLAVNVGGTASSSSDAPRETKLVTWDVTVDGIGDAGAIVYGLVPAAVEAIDVNIAGRSTVTLPVASHQDNTLFAVPLPAGLGMRTIEFLDGSGATLHEAAFAAVPVPAAGAQTYLDRPFGTDTLDRIELDRSG